MVHSAHYIGLVSSLLFPEFLLSLLEVLKYNGGYFELFVHIITEKVFILEIFSHQTLMHNGWACHDMFLAV